LQRAAQSGIKEVDWQAQYQALSTARRLAQHHHTTLAPPLALKAFVAVTAPVIDALRSTLSRLAIAIFVVGLLAGVLGRWGWSAAGCDWGRHGSGCARCCPVLSAVPP
jgi:hypothetical protein